MAKQLGLLGSHLVEILHIDTAGSRDFYSKCETSIAEKSLCQQLLQDVFVECVVGAGGELGFWAGDGGIAFFKLDGGAGKCIKAASAFLNRLPQLDQQTRTTLGDRVTLQDARRSFRIHAHCGQVYFGPGGSPTASGRPEEFDDFIKFEKSWSIKPNEFYITTQMWNQLNGAQRREFELVRGPEKHGSLESELYRYHQRVPKEDTKKRFLEAGFDHREMTPSEWGYLLKQLHSYKVNVAARNSITKGLIDFAAQKQTISRNTITQLTLEALHQYLAVEREPADFTLALWSCEGKPHASMKITAVYPRAPVLPDRQVAIADTRYKSVCAYQLKTPVVVPSIDAARMARTWVEFDPANGKPRAVMQSSMQIPIYRKVDLGNDVFDKQPIGVLSINSDKPDLFVQHEVQNWVDDLVGFLANLALGEQMSQAAFL